MLSQISGKKDFAISRNSQIERDIVCYLRDIKQKWMGFEKILVTRGCEMTITAIES